MILDPYCDPQFELEEEADIIIPDVTLLRISNNIITSGGNSAVTISCDVKEAGTLTVKIYDAKGKEIKTLWDRHKEAGTHPFPWTGVDVSGNKVGSGIYIVHMKADGYSETKKIAVIK